MFDVCCLSLICHQSSLLHLPFCLPRPPLPPSPPRPALLFSFLPRVSFASNLFISTISTVSHLPSALCLPSSAFCRLSSVLRRPSSLIPSLPRSLIFRYLLPLAVLPASLASNLFLSTISVSVYRHLSSILCRLSSNLLIR